MRLLLIALTALLFAAPAQAATPWSRGAGLALLDYGQHVDTQGLDPGDYELDKLKAAVGGSDQAALDMAATRSFALLARDLANGRVPAAQRRLSYFRGMGLQPEAVPDLIEAALAPGGSVAATLDRLAPSNPEYRMLRSALISLPPSKTTERTAVRVNLERWRWLPRDLGEHYLIVNIPEFVVREVDRGQVVATHRVIVGKKSTPTPQFATRVNGVIFNPPWRVPQSIIAESVGALVRKRPAEATKRGYVWTSEEGRLQVTQQPGPTNSLGQVKLDMPNPLAIYLHDTPAKALFDQKVRTYSHGCIRTDKVQDLAARLLAGTDWTAERIASTIEGRETVTAALPRPLPVYIVYLTARAESDGNLALFDDPYRLDAVIAGRLGAEAKAARETLASSECAAAIGG
jgi:murein L,D-transpeptidase YcbB/YkuD